MAKKDEDKTKSAPDENPGQKPEQPGDGAPEPKKAKQVRVICDGFLGTKLLVKGDVTDDPSYVAILARKGQRLVEAVK
ncbi:MAG TPA: hypothetical protein PKC89_14985 [Pyrinomonadaceae bacterium]|nr:hypothetical protein [Pyrinomonadaceae bacterium]